MRAVIVLLLLSLPVLADGQTPVPPEPKPLPQGASLDIVVQEMQGDVDVRTDPKGQWQPAKKGMRLPVGTIVSTADGASTGISFGTNSAVVLTEMSIMTILSYGMQGDGLVAKVSLDPGVAHVSVKQLPQFRTDFQVSSPRLTCSVRGSGGWFYFWGDELESSTFCDDDMVHQKTAGQDRTILVGGKGNSNNESSVDIANKDNVANISPTGSTKQETFDANLLTTATTSTATVISEVNQDISPSPSNGTETNETPAPTPSSGQLSTPQETALLNLALGGEDVASHVSQDPLPLNANSGPISLSVQRLSIESLQQLLPSFGGGLEDPTRSNLKDFAVANGFPSFVDNAFGPYVRSRATNDPTHLALSNSALLSAIQSDFHSDTTGVSGFDWGFDNYLTVLHDLDNEAKTGDIDTLFGGKTLLFILHAEFEVAMLLAPPGQNQTPAQQLVDYQSAHTDVITVIEDFHSLLEGTDVTDPNTGFVITADTDHFLAEFGRFMVDQWDKRVGFNDNGNSKFDVNDPFYQPRLHFMTDLLNAEQAYRTATGTEGAATGSQEDFAVTTLADMEGIRHHVNDVNDPTQFGAIDQVTGLDSQIMHVIGLKGSFDVFQAQDDLKSVMQQQNTNPNFTGVGGPALFATRLNEFQTDTFGYNSRLTDWRNSADAARAGTLTPALFGRAIIDHLYTTSFRNFFGEQSGNSGPGFFDFDRSAAQTKANNLNGTLAGGSGYAAFLNQLKTSATNDWVANHPNVPLTDPSYVNFQTVLNNFANQATSATSPHAQALAPH